LEIAVAPVQARSRLPVDRAQGHATHKIGRLWENQIKESRPVGQARQRGRRLMRVFEVTAEEVVMDRMTEKQDADRFLTAISTILSFCCC